MTPPFFSHKFKQVSFEYLTFITQWLINGHDRPSTDFVYNFEKAQTAHFEFCSKLIHAKRTNAQYLWTLCGVANGFHFSVAIVFSASARNVGWTLYVICYFIWNENQSYLDLCTCCIGCVYFVEKIEKIN